MISHYCSVVIDDDVDTNAFQLTSENVVKVILLGDSAVGKSKLVERFLMNGYEPRQLSTYALTLFRHNFQHEESGDNICVDFWCDRGEHIHTLVCVCWIFSLSLSLVRAQCNALNTNGVARCINSERMGLILNIVRMSFTLSLFLSVCMCVRVKHLQLHIHDRDTAGQERFNSIHPSYYYRAHCCILVFDVTRKVTYKNMERWYNELREYCGSIPVIVCANKIDIDYKVTSKSFNFASKRSLPFYFVSAADGTNVVRVFKAAIEAGLNRKRAPPEDAYFEVLELISEGSKQ